MKQNTKTNLWSDTKAYINRYNVGSVITRTALLEKLLKPKYCTTTLDAYLNTLSALGYLETLKRGQYRLFKKIPKNLTYKKALTLRNPSRIF